MKERLKVLAGLTLGAAIAASCGSAIPSVLENPYTPSQKPAPTATATPEAPISLSTPEPIQALKSTIIIWVFAHDDDETLTAGAAIYESQKAGNKNIVVIATAGETSHVGRDLGLTKDQTAAAQAGGTTAALKVIGLTPTLWRIKDDKNLTQDAIVGKLLELIENTPGPVLIRTHNIHDHYAGLKCGQPVHCMVAKAVEEVVALDQGRKIDPSDVREYTIGQLDGMTPFGTCHKLTPEELKIKDAMRAQYARYGLALRSVPEMWEAIDKQPECFEVRNIPSPAVFNPIF